MPDPVDKIPEGRRPEIRVMAMPADTNASGDIFGGWLMSQVDIAGSVIAQQTAGGRVVTVAVNAFQFLKPVFVGDLVSLFAKLIKIGRTSMQVDVTAYAERQRGIGECQLVANASLTYVAIDENRQPRPVQQS